MEQIKPKKERKFLKAVGKVAGILLQEFVLGLGRKFIGKKIDRIGNKRQALLIFLALFCNIAFASIDSIPYPITGNKQRLGWQTTGNGLVWRGLSADTVTKPTNYVDKNVKAYLILDSVRGTIFVWRQTYWDSLLVGGGGGGSFTQPIDSLFFDTSVSPNNVDTAKMRWDYERGTVVLGMYDQVSNELGFKSFWAVKNQTGLTITKGSIVYANGTVGASGRITVAKFIANGTIDAKYLLGITAHDLTDGEDGYVISFGKIRQVNTDTFAAGSILYPSPTVAGVWTDVEPVAPNIDMPIGFCINSSSNNGTIAIRVASGYKLSELHDVAISSPVDKASLYYKSSEGLWRDTTAALLVSDTAAMLTPYFRDADTTILNLTSRFAAKLNISDTSAFASDNQISGTSGQVAYFNSSSSVVSDTALRWSAANKSLGINVTTEPSGASLIIKNSQEPSRSTVVTTQGFAADTTNWTRGTGWTFNGTVAVATAATGNLTYTPALTITSGNAYEVTYTISSYSAGTLTVAVGNATYALPTHNATNNVVLLLPTSATGGFRFTTSTFNGNLDNVSVVQIANPASVLLAGQNDATATLYSGLSIPNSTSIAFGGGVRYTTGTNNIANGNSALLNNTTGTNNIANGQSALRLNTTGNNNIANGLETLRFNTTGSGNIANGVGALLNNTTGTNNVANGNSALRLNTTGGSNIANGQSALFNNTTGSNNVSNGANALFTNTTGSNNIANGADALRLNTTGSSNIANGATAMYSNTSGNNNVANGVGALYFNTIGGNNIANGTSALFNNTTGGNNVANGQSALRSNKTGNNNIANGDNALRSNTTGGNNVANGQSALRSNTTGSYNVADGDNAMYNTVTADTLTGSNNIAIGRNAADNIASAAAGNVAIGNQVDLPTNNGSNQGVYQNVLFFTGASGTGTTIAAASKAGIKTNAPNRDLEVAGEVRITDLTTDTPTRLVGADADGDLGQVTLGAGLSLSSSSLLADTNFLVTRFDTASMLSNYLRTGTAASTYLTQSSAASTYLPLTGGTLTGALSGTTGTFTGLNVNNTTTEGILTLQGYDNNTATRIQFKTGNEIRRQIIVSTAESNMEFRTSTVGGTQGGYSFYTRRNPNPENLAFNIDVDGNSNFYGTLGVTGFSTFSTGAVINENSNDSDTRIESDGNANMVYVDASTDRVGIGTNTPSKTLDVNGELNVSSAGTFGGRLNTNWLERTYSNSTSTTLTVSVNTTWLKLNNSSTITLTLPDASTYPGKELHIKNIDIGAVNSNSSNVEAIDYGSVGTAILPAGPGKWATLVSDGTYWVKMAGN